MLPDEIWDWLCLDGVAYHGRSLTILYEKTGTRYGKGAGFLILADGEVVSRREKPGAASVP